MKVLYHSLVSVPLLRHRVVSNRQLFYHLDDVNCIGNESMLSECTHRGIGVLRSCVVRQDEAGVVCNSKFCM